MDLQIILYIAEGVYGHRPLVCGKPTTVISLLISEGHF